MTEGKRNVPFPPVPFVLTCHPDILTVEGFGMDDIQQLFKWQDGKITLSAEEQRRMRRLELLVVRNM